MRVLLENGNVETVVDRRRAEIRSEGRDLLGARATPMYVSLVRVFISSIYRSRSNLTLA